MLLDAILVCLAMESGDAGLVSVKMASIPFVYKGIFVIVCCYRYVVSLFVVFNKNCIVMSTRYTTANKNYSN